MQNSIKLQTDSVLQAPLQKYSKDFTFIVNSKRFETSSFVADLLSPIISSRHLSDQTLSEFTINTKSPGDFNKIINLINFQPQEINHSDFSFIIEIFDQLGTEKVDINIQNEEKITNDNVLDQIIKHQAHPQFYKTHLHKEIEYFTSHFFELKDKLFEYIKSENFDLNDTIIEEIIGHKKLVLDTEDDLLETVNLLYLRERSFSHLYEFVDFKNVEQESIKSFIENFNIDDLTTAAWLSVCERLEKKVLIEKGEEEQTRHVCNKSKCLVEIKNKPNEFDGIMNYLKKNSNIKDELAISLSSFGGGSDPFDLIKYEDKKCYYETSGSDRNSWISFEFKKHKVCPSGYIIRSYYCDGNWHLKSWDFEGSNDNSSWTTLDKQQNNSVLNGGNNVNLFSISNEESYKYLRIHITGPNWLDNYGIMMNSIEFYGKII